ncbi:MAG: sugar phosphate isomerase/epimerase [Lentisphaerae bacterium]|nr:sugar phosphate isomerase/epimerase [Lentisphaerota bacterium]MBT4816168.1 sugar phosphate isomerase/epimerase [Lentisphaerota bacterium]MBT5605559.1 sugar phosphate isomerase/epimerase [Lentisphaerota bacterium]MBT7056836.1 sugar phosphate isomerase/epimerase [Lentisphaerota bacterium]MBT7845378.1 sugar phosphate isomerase/epimerase [Lentisphaerota bacterium]
MSSLLWYDEPELIPHLPALDQAGVRHIELRRLSPHVNPASPSSVNQLKRALLDTGIALHSVHLPTEVTLAMFGADDVSRQRGVAAAKSVAETATTLGANVLVAHAGGPIRDGDNREKLIEASVEGLSDLCAFCGQLGLPVAIENTLPTTPRVGDTVPELVQLVQQFKGDHVGYCLDTSHANLSGNVTDAVSLVADRLLTLHVSDNDGHTDQHALPFDGTIDWPAFMQGLKRARYTGVFMMEVRGGPHPEQTIRNAASRMKKLLALID